MGVHSLSLPPCDTQTPPPHAASQVFPLVPLLALHRHEGMSVGRGVMVGRGVIEGE